MSSGYMHYYRQFARYCNCFMLVVIHSMINERRTVSLGIRRTNSIGNFVEVRRREITDCTRGTGR